MIKRYFYAMRGEVRKDGPHEILYRFRIREDRETWVSDALNRYPVPGSHPEVRRIKRQIEAGEAVTFPVDVSE